MPDINMQVFGEAQRNQLVTEVDIQTQVALDDYQVQLSDIANPTQSQDNVVIDRFGEFLPHWNESLDFDTWVKVSMEVAGKRILMLRGNSNVSNVSNGDDTFIQWHGSATANFIDSISVSPTNVVYEAKVRETGGTGHNIRVGISNYQNPTDDDSLMINSHGPANGVYIFGINEGVASSLNEPPRFTTNVWYKILITDDGTTIKGYVDGDEIGSGGVTTNLPNENLGLFMHLHTGTGEQEYSFARKYIVTEPIFLAENIPQNIATALKSLGMAG
jgi:hypothetical protein